MSASVATVVPGERMAMVLRSPGVVTVTLQGRDRRYTYRIDPTLQEGRWWVYVLTGADNETSYTFLGGVYEKSGFYRSDRSSIGADAESNKAFSWFVKHPESEALTVLLSRPCIRCGQKLTTPESILRGMGPDCAQKAVHA
jgi:hypothetical protein